MFQGLKRYLDRYPAMASFRRALARRRFELKDVYDSFVSRGLRPRPTPHGFSLGGSNSIHHAAMQRGEFEPEETALFNAIFEETDVFVDVGANVGFYTCLARSKGCHVVAVEPLEKNLQFLFQNLRANHWEDVEVLPMGLSGKPGIATLYGASSTGASLIGNWAGASRLFQRTIALTTLDNVLGRRFDGRRLFVKVDVEGAEYQVLLGALGTIQMQPRPTWVIEVCLEEYHPEGLNPDFAATFELFWKHGYEVRTADARNRLVTPDDVSSWVGSGKCNSGTINYRFGAPQRNAG